MRFFSAERKKYSVVLLLGLCLLVSCRPFDRYVTISGYAQGGTYSVKFNLNGHDGMIRTDLKEVKDSIDAILHAVDMSLSGYAKGSVLSRFNAGQAVSPDPVFLDMYEKAYDIYEETDGIIDVASAPLFDMWGFGFRSGQFPDEDRVGDVLKECGMARLRRDMRSAVAPDGTLEPEDMLLSKGRLPSLNFNAIAQGYSCDLVAEYLHDLGVKDMLVDIGEIFCEGHNPSEQPWTLGIDSPVDGNNEPGADLQVIFKVPDGAHGVVTSGNYRKFYVRDGKKYAHTIDPRTGYPVSHNLLSATVIAPDALTADAYATCCMVIGLEQSKMFIESVPEMEACLIYDDAGEFRIWKSSGFDAR